MRYDVIIIGAGTWGSATAWQLAERGHKVLAVDAFHPPHDFGSHAGATRLARQSNSTGTEYVALTQRAFDLWDQIANRTSSEVLMRSGNVFVGLPGSIWFDRTLQNLQGSPFPYEVLPGAEARARFPRIRVAEEEIAVWEPQGAISLVNPSLRALQRLGREAGAEMRYNEPVLDWRADDSGVVATTRHGSYVADRIVVTAGAFSDDVLRLDLPTAVERQVLANFEIDRSAPSLPSMYFAPPPGSDAAPGYGCPEPDGTFKLSVPTRGNVIDPAELSQDVTPRDIEAVVELARERIPELSGNPTMTTVCMWTETTDGHWLIGRHPEHERVVVGAGCNGRGFRYAPAVGEMLADLTEGKERFDLDRFDLRRHHISHRENSDDH